MPECRRTIGVMVMVATNFPGEDGAARMRPDRLARVAGWTHAGTPGRPPRAACAGAACIRIGAASRLAWRDLRCCAVVKAAPPSDGGCLTGNVHPCSASLFSTQSSQSGAQRAQRRDHCNLRSRQDCTEYVICQEQKRGFRQWGTRGDITHPGPVRQRSHPSGTPRQALLSAGSLVCRPLRTGPSGRSDPGSPGIPLCRHDVPSASRHLLAKNRRRIDATPPRPQVAIRSSLRPLRATLRALC
jgi:hypothetical protein